MGAAYTQLLKQESRLVGLRVEDRVVQRLYIELYVGRFIFGGGLGKVTAVRVVV